MDVFTKRKANAYATTDATASRDERIARLKSELRDHIRSLADFRFLSVEWLKMAESLQQVANVALMESHMPGSEGNTLRQAGKKSVGTLWDQEKDELAVRILLEEGKLNLCLRILQGYKDTEAQADFSAQLERVSRQFDVELSRVIERCRTFERSLGSLLRLAFEHVEALQILDLPSLVQHCAAVLSRILNSQQDVAPVDVEKTQETLVIQYLCCLALKMEEINEDRVMELLLDNNIFHLIISVMHKRHAWYKTDTQHAFVHFLNLTMSSEAYVTSPDTFIATPELKQMLLELNGVFMDEAIRTFTERRQSQALLDNIARFARLFPEMSTGNTTEEGKTDS
eukprot:TRINITY_DN1358_c0_g1_i1.p1 TRINITY_DN1358_c0_g1~~TRINITY_DN1358_c0_g1_i1.p1  ORF type:complete len:361 (-),score=93.18 TRINITY_DN1358_c0_g1_i1:117-1139(-)